MTARLEPATIDGLVYCSSMVVLYAARHQLRVPALARWLLALGIVATLAANVAHWLAPRTDRRGRRGLARRQPRRQLRIAAVAHPVRRRWSAGARASRGPGRRTSGPVDRVG